MGNISLFSSHYRTYLSMNPILSLSIQVLILSCITIVSAHFPQINYTKAISLFLFPSPVCPPVSHLHTLSCPASLYPIYLLWSLPCQLPSILSPHPHLPCVSVSQHCFLSINTQIGTYLHSAEESRAHPGLT